MSSDGFASSDIESLGSVTRELVPPHHKNGVSMFEVENLTNLDIRLRNSKI